MPETNLHPNGCCVDKLGFSEFSEVPDFFRNAIARIDLNNLASSLNFTCSPKSTVAITSGLSWSRSELSRAVITMVVNKLLQSSVKPSRCQLIHGIKRSPDPGFQTYDFLTLFWEAQAPPRSFHVRHPGSKILRIWAIGFSAIRQKAACHGPL